MLRTLARRRFQFLALTLFFLVMGCGGVPQRPPTAEPPTGPAPTDSPVPATPTLAPPTATPATFVRLKNAKSATYLYDADGQAKLAELSASDPAFEWAIEDYQGSKRLWNRASGNYLSIEHLQAYIEIISIYPEWMSPRWTFETDKATGSTILRNVWHNWQIMYVKDGQLKYDRFPTMDDGSHWLFESSDGSVLAESTATPVIVLPTAAQPAGSRGATVPWVEYEAEESRSTGEILAPDRTFGTIAAESSGRSAVKLDQTGESLQFQTTKAANSVVVRYVIPDSEDGAGQAATLSLYVNNTFRQKLQLTSKYAWSYGGETLTLNTPKAEGAHHFYDEARALVGDIPAGATVKLQKDDDDSADYYVVDLVDLEQVAPPKEMPAGYLSIVTDCGATPNDGRDDGAAIQTCIDKAGAAKTGVWIPSGTFDSTTHPFELTDVTLQGAGMWYSTIHGLYARFSCIGNNCHYFDFAILGETVLRDDQSPENGFNGGAGTGSRLENIWVEHTKVGYWVGPGASNGLIILNSRFRNLFADGVNFCNGTSNSVVENSHFRNTGDDALASWSPHGSGVNTNNVFRFNTVQVPWRANCYAIYGGQNNAIEDNVCSDVVTYPGILVAQNFDSNLFAGTTRVERNTLIRAGGPMFRKEHGALKLQAAQEAMSQIVVKDILIDSPTFAGIELEGRYALKGITFENIRIVNPGTWGIRIQSDVTGDVTFTQVTVSNPGKDGLLNYAPSLYFTLTKGTGNSGW